MPMSQLLISELGQGKYKMSLGHLECQSKEVFKKLMAYQDIGASLRVFLRAKSGKSGASKWIMIVMDYNPLNKIRRRFFLVESHLKKCRRNKKSGVCSCHRNINSGECYTVSDDLSEVVTGGSSISW